MGLAIKQCDGHRLGALCRLRYGQGCSTELLQVSRNADRLSLSR